MVLAGDGDDARGVEALGLDGGALGAVRVGDGGVPGQEVEVVACGGVADGGGHGVGRRRRGGVFAVLAVELLLMVVHGGGFKCQVHRDQIGRPIGRRVREIYFYR